MKTITTAMLCAATALTGCGGHSLHTTLPSLVATTHSASAASTTVTDTTMTAASADVAMPTEVAESLTPAPWSVAPMSPSDAPRALITAWSHADNRGECAPLAPTALGAGMGARPRSASYAGGWAIEFDKPGLPGVTANGNTCAHCGRGAFGIAGTSMSPDSLDEDVMPGERWSDGSHAEVQPTDEEAQQGRVATLVVSGQDCVYQVWSFLGEEHLHELVAGLRRVDAQ